MPSAAVESMNTLNSEEIARAVRIGLEEDIGPGDVTTLATIPETARATAQMTAREPMVVAGLPLAEAVFRALDASVQIEVMAKEGQSVSLGQVLLRLNGLARAVLSGERVSLNFVQRLSGIATLTAQYVAAVQGTRARILDTRKTTPGWRRLEKYAVACGGGKNHRFGLFDQVLIKDNHLAALAGEKPNPVSAAIRRSRIMCPGLKVEVEADTIAQAQQAADAGADIILLDNMSLEQLRAAVQLIDGLAQTEASGGVNLQTARAIAQTGVDFISVGALTHSARSVDIGLDFVS